MRPSLILLAIAVLSACGTSSATSIPAGSGLVRLQLTDAPFPFDSVQSVDVWVVRVDAKLADADSGEAARGASDDSATAGGWRTLATPNKSYDLVKLRGGAVADLGQGDLPKGEYRGFRLVIDPNKSQVVLKGGLTLTGRSDPPVTVPSASRSGIKINLTKALAVGADSTSTMIIDFDLEQSFVMRGNSIGRNGLLFKPVLHATSSSS